MNSPKDLFRVRKFNVKIKYLFGECPQSVLSIVLVIDLKFPL